MRDGLFDGQELYYRCWHCGDSPKHPSKAHCSVNIFTSVYYCLRCQASGRLGSHDFEVLTRGLKLDFSKRNVDLSYEPDVFIQTISEKIRPGQGLERYSALDRWHIKTESGAKLDVFKVTDPGGELVGYHVRPPKKKETRTYGKRMFGMSPKIRYNRTWRLVEGPWDCIDPHTDVCCFGFPSEMQARSLVGKRLILCPDGDVFQDYRKLRAFMKPLLWNTEVIIDYIERLPPDTDPDEQMPSQRERLEPGEVRSMLQPTKSYFTEWMKPDQILENIRGNRTEEEFWGQYA